MTREEKLRALAEVLKIAATKARGLSSPGYAIAREHAFATQLEGIAMEFEAHGHLTPEQHVKK